MKRIILVAAVFFMVMAYWAMTNENNYKVNPCPNAPHNQVDNAKLGQLLEKYSDCNECSSNH